MCEIEMQEMSPEFLKCWKAAGMHLHNQVQGGIKSWIRAHQYPPFLEHLSFRLGNQLFFIRVEDVSGKVAGPGSLHGLLTVAKGNGGHACLLPMRENFFGGDWVPQESGWGLVDAISKKAIDPVSLVTDEKIEMTSWEVHDMAVQIVRDYLRKDGYQVISWQSNPENDPAIWFVGDSKGPEWVVVRAVRYPQSHAPRPANWQAIVNGCARMSRIGHFASVAFASTEQAHQTGAAIPLWRGHGTYVRFTGLDNE